MTYPSRHKRPVPWGRVRLSKKINGNHDLSTQTEEYTQGGVFGD